MPAGSCSAGPPATSAWRTTGPGGKGSAARLQPRPVAGSWHHGSVTAAPSAPSALPDAALESALGALVDRPWVTVVWDDPVNLMTYVTYVFMTYFKYPRAEAERFMLQVHEEGRAAVSSGTREEMEVDAAAMHSYGLWATIQKAE